MMQESALPNDAHPSPHRGNVSASLLFLGLFAGPVGWGVQLVANYSIASHACYPGDRPLIGVPLPGHSIWIVVFIINIVAACLALAGAALSYQHWRATRAEHAGSALNAVEVGEGRSRFLALWGVMTGSGFFLAILFNTLALFMVPQCIG